MLQLFQFFVPLLGHISVGLRDWIAKDFKVHAGSAGSLILRCADWHFVLFSCQPR